MLGISVASSSSGTLHKCPLAAPALRLAGTRGSIATAMMGLAPLLAAVTDPQRGSVRSGTRTSSRCPCRRGCEKPWLPLLGCPMPVFVGRSYSKVLVLGSEGDAPLPLRQAGS